MGEPPELKGVLHEYVDAGGLRTHVALAGPPDAPAVLLVHGWPQNWWTWRHVIPTLAEHFRVIAPDLRGHGWSEAPATGRGLQTSRPRSNSFTATRRALKAARRIGMQASGSALPHMNTSSAA